MKTKLLLFFVLAFTAFNVSAQVTSVALVGPAVDGCWPSEACNPGPTDPTQLNNPSGDGINWIRENVVLTTGPCKLRANNTWGGAGGEWAGAFPTAIGTSSGDINAIAGTYTVTLNSATGEYNFTGGAPIPVIKLIGTSVTPPTGITMTTVDAITYTVTAPLLEGTAQFEADGVVFGDVTFPTGTIVDDATLFIPVSPAASYVVTLNINDGVYNFVPVPVYPSIAIVGSGAGGWPNDPQVDANVLTTTDGETYKASKIALTAGDIKFRADNSWATSWGGVTFPTGPDAGNPGENIVVTTPGTYDVVFTRSTGAYVFSFPTIALVGSGAGGWPNDPQVDVNVLTTADGVDYTLNGVTLTDGEAKFRANNGWDVNWGVAAFPTGTGTQGGANIPTTAGLWDVTLNRVTGVFGFTPGLSTDSFAANNFKVYPNPTNSNWNFSAKESITNVTIMDVLGKVVLVKNANSNTAVVDASALNNGIYFAKVTTANAIGTVKLVKN